MAMKKSVAIPSLNQSPGHVRRAMKGGTSTKGTSKVHGPDAPKPWSCNWDDAGRSPPCQKSFGRKSDLQRHHHTHTGTRNHACHYQNCGKTFIQTSALTVHIRTHTGEKPHECEVCGKCFSDSSSLARHRKIHSNTRPYPCDSAGCPKSFCRKSTLNKHLERDHPLDGSVPEKREPRIDRRELAHKSNPNVLGDEVVGQTQWEYSQPEVQPPYSATVAQQPMADYFGNVTQREERPQQSPYPLPTSSSPDPTYRHYPHPELSMNQVDNVSIPSPLELIPSSRLSHYVQASPSTSSVPTHWSDASSAVHSNDVAYQNSPQSLSSGSTPQENLGYGQDSVPHDGYQHPLDYSNHPPELQYTGISEQPRTSYPNAGLYEAQHEHQPSNAQTVSLSASQHSPNLPVVPQLSYQHSSGVSNLSRQNEGRQPQHEDHLAQQNQQAMDELAHHPDQGHMIRQEIGIPYNHSYNEPVDAGIVDHNLPTPAYGTMQSYQFIFEKDAFDLQPLPGQWTFL